MQFMLMHATYPNKAQEKNNIWAACPECVSARLKQRQF